MDQDITSKMDSVFFTRRAHKHYSSLSENLKKMLYSEFLKVRYFFYFFPDEVSLESVSQILRLEKFGWRLKTQ